MSFSAFLVAVLGVNLLCAVIAAYLAQRWGRDPFGWILVCAVLGPFGLIALGAMRPGTSPQPAPISSGESRDHRRRQVLVPVDGSQQALESVRYIAEQMPDAEAVLITVLPTERGEGAAAAAARRDEMEKEAAGKFAAAEQILRDAGVPFRREIAFGDPASEILNAAAAESISLIVIGRRGGGLSRALLGSVSDRVVKQAETPVTVAG